MIELIEINKSFGPFHALTDINLFVQEGEIICIIGKSGAGKSTLLRTINLLERPDSGDILVNNQFINALKPRQLNRVRQKMAMIFQHFNLLNTKTVYDNIALPCRMIGCSEDAIKEKIMDLLALVDLTDKKDCYPAELSGGQKQRVAIARALSTSPTILLCDEATSALDPKTTESILDLLKKINQNYGITIVMVTHEMDVVKRVGHRLAVMESGKIIELMSLSEIFNHPDSQAYQLLYTKLSPELPTCISDTLTQIPTRQALVKLFFQGQVATLPFISESSRLLHLDINILLANIDRFGDLTCGVLIVSIQADQLLLASFINRCGQAHLTVEILGYVTDSLD